MITSIFTTVVNIILAKLNSCYVPSTVLKSLYACLSPCPTWKIKNNLLYFCFIVEERNIRKILVYPRITQQVSQLSLDLNLDLSDPKKYQLVTTVTIAIITTPMWN